MIGPIRQYLRRVLPPQLRLNIARFRRVLSDLGTARHFSFIAPTSRISTFEKLHVIARVTQQIRHSDHWQGKLKNVQRGAELLHGALVPPGRMLSFWTLVGPPSWDAGFAIGRAIRADQVGEDVGGGLCQLSGLLYELGLRAGMTVVERHPHSQDLYNDATRFTPLGLDATVVWGYKDLRLRNIGETLLTFAFYVNDERIEGVVMAPVAFAPADIYITQTEQDTHNTCNVKVWRSNNSAPMVPISSDFYVQQPKILSENKQHN